MKDNGYSMLTITPSSIICGQTIAKHSTTFLGPKERRTYKSFRKGSSDGESGYGSKGFSPKSGASTRNQIS